MFNQNFKNMNKELLFQLYKLHSPSGCEKKMRKFLKRMARACNADKIEQDAHGNIFITKGFSDTYPCLASHMDQVQHAHSKDFVCVEGEDVVFGYSPKSHEQQGLGADDKNGIYICLECLKKYDVLKVAFFVGEETGCVGSRACDLGFFSDCRFVIEPDRRGNGDLITSMMCGEVCSKEFINAISPFAKAHGYSEEHGSITDVGELVERYVGISCLNLSCGYYEAHTDHEFTVLSELQNCLELVQEIIENCTDVYPFTYTSLSYGRGYGRHMPSFRDYNEQLDEEARQDFENILMYHPQTTFEEALYYLSWDVIGNVSSFKLQGIFEECKSLYLEADEELPVVS